MSPISVSLPSPSYYPYAQIIPGLTYTAVCAGPFLQLIDSSSGTLIQSIRSHDAPILFALVTQTQDGSWGEELVSVGQDKKLKVWRLSAIGLELLSNRDTPKKANALLISPDGQTIIVADKFGDVFSYPLHAPATPLTPPSTPPSLPLTGKKRGDHAAPDGSTLVLGHTSIVTAVLMTPAPRARLFTADRDEHIRVSRFPAGHVIEKFLLGHRRYVSALHLVHGKTLVSGGGDSALFIWDIYAPSGKALQYNIDIEDVVRPTLRVRKAKTRWYKVNRAKLKADKLATVAGEERSTKADPPSINEPIKDFGISLGTAPALDVDRPFDLVISKIQSFTIGGPESTILIFSAVGSSAMFAVPLLQGSGAVTTIELGAPVLEFALGPIVGDVWVSIDEGWRAPDSGDVQVGSIGRPVRLLRWVENKLVEQTLDEKDSPLLAALNTHTRVVATAEERTALDLYDLLATLPKGTPDEGSDDEGDEAEDGSHKSGPADLKTGSGPTKSDKRGGKIAGRQKVKDILEKNAPKPLTNAGEGVARDIKKPRVQ